MRSRPAIIFCDVLYAGVPHNTPSLPTGLRQLRRPSRHARHVCNNWGLAMSIGMIQHQGGDGCGFCKRLDFLTFTCFLLHIKNLNNKKTQRASPGTVPIPDHGCKPQANSDESIGIHLEKYPGGPFNVCSTSTIASAGIAKHRSILTSVISTGFFRIGYDSLPTKWNQSTASCEGEDWVKNPNKQSRNKQFHCLV